MAAFDISIQSRLKLFNEANDFDDVRFLIMYSRFYKYYNEINIDYFDIKS